MGHLGDHIHVPLKVSHFQAMWIRNGSLFIGITGLEKSDHAMKSTCSNLTGYYSFGDPNDQVLKNNMPLFMET